MSRKSRLAVYRDRLEAVSECPSTIFYNFEPSDDDFSLIAQAESGDVEAIESLSKRLYSLYADEESLNAALPYFLKLGIDNGSSESALIFIKCMDSYNKNLDLFDSALSTLTDDHKESIKDIIDRVKLKKIISAPSDECDFVELSESLSIISTSYRSALELYLEGMAFKHTGVSNKEKVESSVRELKLENLLLLTCFGEQNCCKASLDDKSVISDIEKLRDILSAFDICEWRDFWAKVMYEYAVIYLDGDLISFAHDFLHTVLTRPAYKTKALHELALKKYILLCGLGYSEEECLKLEEECRFMGLNVEQTPDTVIRDAILNDNRNANISFDYDGEIVHERNRYTLTMSLANHRKRASSHRWDAVLVMKTGEDIPPIMQGIPIVERRAEISRNGVRREKEKKAAQILCRGEIRINERSSPFELDLIIDISHVSTTKCTHLDIKIERYKRLGEYLIMQTDISLYDELTKNK